MTTDKQARPIRYAVVGLGNIAQVAVLPAFKNTAGHAELVALISGNADKLAQVAARQGGDVRTGGYDELEQILADRRVDAVYIATPTAQHRALTERAAKVGVHVLCEKPMAPTVADCEAMIAACKAGGVKLMIAYRLHFEEANLRAIEAVRTGEIGDPRIFSSVFTQQVRPGDVRTKSDLAGGAIYDVGVYPINAARYILREEPIAVQATVSSSGDQRFDGVDETTTAVLRFASGRVAQLTASLGASSVGEYRVVGTEGDLHAEPIFAYVKDLALRVTRDGKTREQKFPKRDQFAPELLAFANCIRDDSEPEASGEEGLADIRIVEAILESAKSGKLVKLAPFTRDRRPDLTQEIHKPWVDPPEPIDAPAPAIR